MGLKTTPLLGEHRKLGAKMASFGGWLMPIQYEGIIAEHAWTRVSCSVFDICHMGEFLLEGAAVQSDLERILTAKIGDMSPGSCRYGFMLNEGGGIVDDVVAYSISRDKWMLVVNAVTIGSDEAHLKKYLSTGTALQNVSSGLAKLDVQGPLSRDVLKGLIGEGISGLKYYTFGYFSVMGERNIISRTGYTGELGYEVYVSAERVKNLWETLLADNRAKPAGLGARDTLRLEMCYPLYGQDIDGTTTPLDAGLERFVSLGKDFIGKEAILRRRAERNARKLVCFIADSRRSPRHNFKIFENRQEIGMVTSGSFSPSLSAGIGMGYIEDIYADIGTEIFLREGNVEIKAKIAQRPLYKKGTART